MSYKCYDNKGAFVASYSIEVERCTAIDDGFDYEFLFVFKKADGKPLLRDNGKVKMGMSITSKGSVSNMPDLRTATAIQDYMTMGDISKVPQNGKAGDVLENGTLTVNIGSVVANVVFSERKILAEEQLDTPAGSFSCLKISEKQKLSAFIINSENQLISWYVKGIGCIKQEAYDKNGKLTHSIVIESAGTK